MKQRRRRYFTDAELDLAWDRWQKGESLNAIARELDRGHSAVQGAFARTGGVRPPQRSRSQVALSLAEREEISRGLATGDAIEPARLMKPRGIEHAGRRSVNWYRTRRWPTSWPRSCSWSGLRGRSLDG